MLLNEARRHKDKLLQWRKAPRILNPGTDFPRRMNTNWKITVRSTGAVTKRNKASPN